jgi:hypothetical protein
MLRPRLLAAAALSVSLAACASDGGSAAPAPAAPPPAQAATAPATGAADLPPDQAAMLARFQAELDALEAREARERAEAAAAAQPAPPAPPPPVTEAAMQAAPPEPPPSLDPVTLPEPVDAPWTEPEAEAPPPPAQELVEIQRPAPKPQQQPQQQQQRTAFDAVLSDLSRMAKEDSAEPEPAEQELVSVRRRGEVPAQQPQAAEAEPMALTPPEPVAAAAPEAVIEPETVPASVIEPPAQIAAAPEPEPVFQPQPAPMPEPEIAAEAEPAPEPEPMPEIMAAAPEPEPVAAPAPEPEMPMTEPETGPSAAAVAAAEAETAPPPATRAGSGGLRVADPHPPPASSDPRLAMEEGAGRRETRAQTAAVPRAGFETEIPVSGGAGRSPFTDIPTSGPLAEAASYLYDAGVIGGFPDGSFKPEDPLSRASAVKFVMLMRGDDVDQRANGGRFRDLVDGEWYTSYMITAVDNGVLPVPASRLLRPGDTITVREFMDVFARAITPPGSGEGGRSGEQGFSDEQLVTMLRRYDMFPRLPGGPENLDYSMNRGQALVALYAFLATPQVHYIGIREGQYPQGVRRGSGRCYRFFGHAHVTVKASSKPLTLALAAHEPTIWDLDVEPGALLDRVYLSGYHVQRINGVPDSVAVRRSFYFTETSAGDDGEKQFFTDNNNPERGYFLGGCTDDEYTLDGAAGVPAEEDRTYLPVRSGGLFFEAYRDEAACGGDSFCRQQATTDRANFRRITGQEISVFQGVYSGSDFTVTPQ